MARGNVVDLARAESLKQESTRIAMRRVVRTAIVALLIPGLGCSADFSFGAGAGPSSGSVGSTNFGGLLVGGQAGATVLLNAGFDFWSWKSAQVGVEIPLSIYGSQRASIHAIPSGSFVTSYSERPTVTLTPGLRVRWAGPRRISPWVAFGGGMARIDRTGIIFDAGRPSATQSDIKFVPALAPAAGADIRLRGRWFLRGEFRAFLYRTPGVGFVASEFDWNQWHSNPTGIVSLVYRR